MMILVGTNDISRFSDEQEALGESMMVCLFTTLWQKQLHGEGTTKESSGGITS